MGITHFYSTSGIVDTKRKVSLLRRLCDVTEPSFRKEQPTNLKDRDYVCVFVYVSVRTCV